MTFTQSHQTGRFVSVRVVIIGAVLAAFVAAGIVVALTTASAGEHSEARSAPKPTLEAVDPQLSAAHDAAASTVKRLLPVANNATGIASAEAVAALQLDVAGLDTASRVGSQVELDAAAAEVQASLAAFATSAADTCEAHLAAGAGGASWTTEVADDCAAVRAALSTASDVVPALIGLEAVGAPAAP